MTEDWDPEVVDATSATVQPAATPVDPAETPGGAEDQFLLVLDGASSYSHKLPVDGEVIVGRSQTATLRVDDQQISRHHAKLSVRDNEVTIVDLDSQNGTLVNGERLTGGRLLLTGDMIAIGRATLVFHGGRHTQSGFHPLDFPRFRDRLAEEVERARRTHRPFVVACVDLGKKLDGRRVAVALGRLLSRLDAATWGGDTQLFVLLPETDADEARAAADRLLTGLQTVGADARVGYALGPADASTADALLSAARTAVVAAPARGVAGATGESRQITVNGVIVIVADPAMARMYALIERLGAVGLPVLLTGETGSGKELAARALHDGSARRARPFVAVNCAALPDTLVESELFGYERGAFSGAVSAKLGLLESASGGTAFLDEIGELPLAAQAKLLRVLESGRLTRLGELKEREIDVRIVAATNRDLQAEVKAGRFRQDLYFRLAGASVRIPPLRERPAEIAMLAQRFLDEACARAGRPPMTLSAEARALLLAHAWPGNVRELKNLANYAAAAHADASSLEGWHVAERLTGGSGEATAQTPAPAAAPSGSFRPLADEVRDLERARISQALEAAGGNQTKAAALLGVPLRTFFDKVRVHGLSPRRGRKDT